MIDYAYGFTIGLLVVLKKHHFSMCTRYRFNREKLPNLSLAQQPLNGFWTVILEEAQFDLF